MSAGSPHLELDELLAEVSGEAVSDRAWVHLAACRQCQGEAERWEAVAAGVRHLVVAVPVPAWQPGGALAAAKTARSSLPRNLRPRRPADASRRPRRVMAAAAATALVAGGVCYGLVTGSGGGRPGGPVTAAGLTAVSGCSGLVAALGTAGQVNGASLTLTTPRGQPVTVTTSASAVSREVPGSVSDITDGARVFLRGIYASGKIRAYSVSIGVAPKLPEPGFGRRRPARARPWIGAGTVRDAGRGRFILVVPGGARVPVATPDSTIVFTLVHAGLSQIRAGDYVVAVGRAGPGGTLIAATVEEGASLPHDRGNGISSLRGIGCSPSTVAAAAIISAS